MSLGLESRSKGLRPGKLVRLHRYFGPFLRESRWPMLGAFLCGLGAVLTQLLRPWPIKIVFDVLLMPSDAAHSTPWMTRLEAYPPETVLLIVSLSLLLIALLWGLCSYWQAYLTARAGQTLVYALRERAHAHLQRLSLSFHQQRQRGDLLMRLTGDINVLRDMLVDSMIQGLYSSIMLIVMMAILFRMDWHLALLVAALMPPLALTTFRFSSSIRSAARRQRKNEGRTAAVAAETLQGIRLIQAFGGERWRNRSFKKTNRRSLRAGLRTTRLEASMSRVIEVLLALGTGVVLFYGARRVILGALTPGDLLVFISYVHSSFKPFRKLARVSSRLAKAMVCAERVKEVLRTSPAVQDPPNAKRAKHLTGDIRFSRVSFRYPGSESTLRKVSFEVAPRSLVAIVGPSGAGKSTLLALLLRLFEPRSGSIRVDGKRIERYTAASLRNQMTIVLQEALLFGTTVRENIALTGRTHSDDELRHAAELANAWEFIEALPDGLDTPIAEAGASLSAGQRQRIAIARAFLRKKPILLLDEPTTGLDGVAEARVLTALQRLMRDRTTLLVTHKVTLARTAQQILVLKSGRVTEIGSHSELVALGGWYAKAWRRQQKRGGGAPVLPFTTRQEEEDDVQAVSSAARRPGSRR